MVMAGRVRKQLDILEGPLLKNILLFSFPLILSNLLQVFYTAADMMIVGLSGVEGAVGAIGTCSPMINLIVGLVTGFSIGANVVVARAIGARDEKRVERAVHTSVALSFVCGLLSGVAGVLFCRQLLILLGNEGRILDMATAYCRVYFAGLPFGMVTNFCGSIFRAKGNTRITLVVLGIAGAMNVVLNLFFVLVCGMNVVGVALATRISSVFSATVLLWRLCRQTDVTRFSFRKMKIYTEEAKDIILVGVPSSIQNGITQFSLMLVQSAVVSVNNQLCPGGSYVLDGHAAGSSLESFISNANSSVATGVVTFFSQHYGAGKLRRIRSVVWNSYLLVFLISLLGGGIMLLCNDALASFYVSDPRAVDVVLLRNSIMMPFYSLVAFTGINASMMRGIGYPIGATVVSLLGLCLFRVIWVTFVFPHFETLTSIYISYPISWTITMVFGFVLSNILLNKKIKRAEAKLAMR